MARFLNFIFVIGVVLTIIKSCSGYGFLNSKMEDFVMCRMVASEIGDYNAVQVVEDKASAYIKEKGTRVSNQDIMQMTEYVNNEVLELYKLSRQGKEERIYKVYQSGKCQEIYESR